MHSLKFPREVLLALGKEEYLFDRIIGSGSYGNVYSGFSLKTMGMVAIKVIKLNRKGEEYGNKHLGIRIDKFLTEVHNHQNIKSHYAVEFLDAYCTRYKNDIYGVIVEEKFDKDLYDLLSEYDVTIQQRDKICKIICKFVRDCHKSKIAHLDLKPENVFVKYRELGNRKISITSVKVGDFGCSLSLKKPFSTPKLFGTKEYNSPEYTKKLRIYPKKCDIWSLGMVLHVIRYNLFLPVFDEGELSYNHILGEWDEKDYSFYNLMEQMLKFDAKSRPSIKKILKHRYFSDNYLMRSSAS